MTEVSTNFFGYGPVLTVGDISSAAGWLEENLFFSPVKQACAFAVLKNGNCTLYLRQGESKPPLHLPIESYQTGLAHIALTSAKIDTAIEWCKAKRLNTTLDGGKSFFNPKVYGAGERYFNIHSPFGVTFEVSQRMDKPTEKLEQPIICGLDHLGVPCADLAAELKFFAAHGFAPEFEVVTNWNAEEGTIRCIMVRNKEITLELYQFIDRIATAPPMESALAGIQWQTEDVSPSGVKLIKETRGCCGETNV